MTLSWGTLDVASTPAWSQLLGEIALYDQSRETYSAEELAEELAAPGFDPSRDTIAVRDGGELIGCGQILVADRLAPGGVRTHLFGGVHPDYRGRGIGRTIMDHLELAAKDRAAAKHPGAPVLLQAPGGIDGASVRRLLEHRGYRIVRYFSTMSRPLPGNTPLTDRGGGPGRRPAGEQRAYSPELSEAVRIAHNVAFTSHWGSTGRSESEWINQLGSHTFRPALSFVHLADDAVTAPIVDSYVLAYQHDPGVLYIGQVGTLDSARGQGLARAGLIASLRAAARVGYVKAELVVDSVNPTGAGALYESLGFRVERTSATYEKVVPG